MRIFKLVFSFLFVVFLVIGEMLIFPSVVFGQSAGGSGSCTGGNVCFCDPEATCCGEAGTCFPPAGGGTTTWTCFAAGTKVTVPKSNSMVSVVSDDKNYETRNIEDIKVGDKVLSQDETGNKSISTVTKLDQPVRDHMCRVDFAEGAS